MAANPRRIPLGDFLGPLLFLVLLPFILLTVVGHVLFGLILSIVIWATWIPRGQVVLLVYSDSPIWRDRIEQDVLPRLGKRAVVLNWSQRKQWTRSLAVLAFRHFGGAREFNPLAVVFHPFRPARRLRFYEPYRELKHGNPEAVGRLEDELFQLVGV